MVTPLVHARLKCFALNGLVKSGVARKHGLKARQRILLEFFKFFNQWPIGLSPLMIQIGKHYGFLAELGTGQIPTVNGLILSVTMLQIVKSAYSNS